MTNSVFYATFPPMTEYRLHPTGLLVGSDGSIWKPTSPRQGKGKRGLYSQIHFRGATKRVQQLVLDVFDGPRLLGYCCHHKDGNTLNNDISNLMYIHNTSHIRGSMHGNAHLTEDEVRSIRSLAKTKRICDIARKLKRPYHLISDVVYGRAWAWLK